MYEGPTFGDVAQFYTVKHVLNHFSPNTRNKTNADSNDIRDFFTRDQWIYFVKLNRRVNWDHSSLKENSGKITIILESDLFEPELMTDAMKRIGLDTAKLDIKEC
jgi:hypothetical protein